MTYENSSDEESFNDSDHLELLPQVEALRTRCVNILNQCKVWDEQKPIEGLYRYTNSLTAEMHFIEKVKLELKNSVQKLMYNSLFILFLVARRS